VGEALGLGLIQDFALTYTQFYTNKKAPLMQGLRATGDSAIILRRQLFQDGGQPPSWILSNRK